MFADLIDDIGIIDVDTHVAEPNDLWTSRLYRAPWGDRVPHVAWDPEQQRARLELRRPPHRGRCQPRHGWLEGVRA